MFYSGNQLRKWEDVGNLWFLLEKLGRAISMGQIAIDFCNNSDNLATILINKRSYKRDTITGNRTYPVLAKLAQALIRASLSIRSDCVTLDMTYLTSPVTYSRSSRCWAPTKAGLAGEA